MGQMEGFYISFICRLSIQGGFDECLINDLLRRRHMKSQHSHLAALTQFLGVETPDY